MIEKMKFQKNRINFFLFRNRIRAKNIKENRIFVAYLIMFC